jgi:sorbitol/mannitol transport system permease protein
VYALLLNRQFRGRAIARTLLITPFLMMPAAAALIWKWSLLDFNFGIVNWALSLIGIPAVAWNTDLPQLTVILVLTWQYAPFMMLIILAGLQSQDTDIMEAAAVDGASAAQQFRYLTVPHLRQYLELAALLGSIFLLQVFDPVQIMTQGAGGTETLPYLLYQRAFVALDIGQAAAYGVVTVLVTIVVATLALRMLFSIFAQEGGRSR